MNLTSDNSSLLNIAAFRSNTVALLACQFGSAVSIALEAPTAAKPLLFPDVHTYDALPVFGIVFAAFATAAPTALEGKQKVVEHVLGDASGDDGALIGCVI